MYSFLLRMQVHYNTHSYHSMIHIIFIYEALIYMLIVLCKTTEST
jgi:hypothetical protein